MMEIIELHSFTDTQLVDLQALMGELSVAGESLTLTREGLQQVVDDPASHLYCLVDGSRIIGCATFCVFTSPSGRKASIEDVVVASSFRGQYLGHTLMMHLISEARRLAPIELCLTSRPVRVAANRLYQSLGFVRKDTNSYRMEL